MTYDTDNKAFLSDKNFKSTYLHRFLLLYSLLLFVFSLRIENHETYNSSVCHTITTMKRIRSKESSIGADYLPRIMLGISGTSALVVSLVTIQPIPDSKDSTYPLKPLLLGLEVHQYMAKEAQR